MNEGILGRFNANPPTESHLIEAFQSKTAIHLPNEYLQFMRKMNGGEGFIGKAYIILWRFEELTELNGAYEVNDYAPGLFLFGSDGGGEAFAFDTRKEGMPIVSVPFVGIDLKLIRPRALTLYQLFEELYRSRK